jgi:AcrR family transcriptional regulator
MPKLTEEQHRARREEILARSVDCFEKKGFHQTSMRDLSQELGLSLGGLYVHFASKEEIIKAIVARDREEARRLFARMTPEVSFREWLAQAVKSETAKPSPIWMQILGEAMLSEEVGDLVREFYAYSAEQLTEIIRRGQSAGIAQRCPRILHDVAYNRFKTASM